MNKRAIISLPARPAAVSTEDTRTLIDRYAMRIDHAHCLSYAMPEYFAGENDSRLMLVDTDDIDNGMLPIVDAYHIALWHVLWVRDEASANATVESPNGKATWPIAPGDSLRVPANGTLRATGGQLGILVTTPAQEAHIQVAAPTHGVDQFHGHNRRTTYALPADLAVHRWKITQPLDLFTHDEGPIIVFSLAGDPAIATPTESLTLRRGQAVLVDTDQPV